jgi:soluble lytic murein transglycosylase-like protein
MPVIVGGFGRAGDGEGARVAFAGAGAVRGAVGSRAQRWNVSAALLGAQLYVEMNFNPFARSRAGAQGIAQFMPATARAIG